MVHIDGIDDNMIANNLLPYEPSHPGELIREELDARHLTQAAFAQIIGVKASLLNEIIKGKRGVNPEMALRLEAAWEVPANFWLNLQREYDLQRARTNKTFLQKLAAIRQVAAMM